MQLSHYLAPLPVPVGAPGSVPEWALTGAHPGYAGGAFPAASSALSAISSVVPRLSASAPGLARGDPSAATALAAMIPAASGAVPGLRSMPTSLTRIHRFSLYYVYDFSPSRKFEGNVKTMGARNRGGVKIEGGIIRFRRSRGLKTRGWGVKRGRQENVEGVIRT